MEAFSVISNLAIFKDLPEEEITKIIPLVKYKTYPKGNTVFMEGDDGKAVHFVKTGRVKLLKTSEDGKELIINILSVNDVFAEVTMFNELAYPVTVETLEKSELGYIYNEDLEALVKASPSLALSLIKILSKRLYEAQLKTKQIALNDAYYRTVDILIKFHEPNKTIRIPRQDLANMVGTARETLSRILSRLKKDGLITFEGKDIRIIDLEKLKNY